jgi:lipoprotein-anchoring transpeptidase ErfK/SrfK
MSICLKMFSQTQTIKNQDQSCRRWYTAPQQYHILIRKSDRQLTLFQSNASLREYPVAIGKPSTPTPEGDFAVAVKITNPGGVLGSRWLGLNFGTYGIHGTNAPWFIGQMVSHGCIRMHDADVDELFGYAYLGMPVCIRD